MESSLQPYIVLTGNPDFTTAVHNFIDEHLPGWTIFVASDTVGTIQTMHHLDRAAIFIVEDIWPDIDSRLLITQNIRKTFRFNSFCFVVTDQEDRVEEFSQFNIRSLRKSRLSEDSSGKRRYNLDVFFIADLKFAIETLKELKVDPLTEIYTLSEMMKRWARDFERARLLKTTTALLAADVNDLKWVNDTYGHLAGDRLIEGVGGVFRSESRDPYDIPTRLYRGDEFGILMPGTKQGGAEKVQSRIQARMANLSIEVRSGVFITPVIACGIAILRPESLGRSPADAWRVMFIAAEKRMNRNKLIYYERLALSGDERGKEKYEQLKNSKSKLTKQTETKENTR